MTIRNIWNRVRRNHALEHATIALLLERGVKGTISGNATPGGFFIYGNLPRYQLTQAITEALQRLHQGDRGLAISSFCGTNLVVGALLTGTCNLLVLGRQSRWKRFPLVLAATLGSVIATAPLGALVQRYVTTDTDLSLLTVARVSSWEVGSRTIHYVATKGK